VQIAKVQGNSGFYDLLGTVLFQQKKDLNGAATALTKALQFDKNNTDARIKLGQVQAANGQVDDAITTYQQGLKDNPQEATYYVLLGQLFQSRRDWNGAARPIRRHSPSSRKIPWHRMISLRSCCNLVATSTSRSRWRKPLDAACQIHPASRIRWAGFTIRKALTGRQSAR